MKVLRRGLIAGGIIFVVFVTGIYIGAVRGNTFAANVVTSATYVIESESAPEGTDLGPLFRAWRLLDKNFVTPSATTSTTSRKEQVYGAINGLTESFGDPYTVFLPPEESKRFEEDISGNFEGVGMEIGIRDDFLVVIAPMPDSPAMRAGLRPADKILRIDGRSTDGMSVEAAVKLIRGPHGTSVRLIIEREGEDPREVSITREVIRIPTLSSTLRSDGIFVISLYNFSAISAEQFRGALREFVQSGSTKLILDLRGNPGGYLEVAVDMASYFLPLGKTVVIEDYAGKMEQDEYRSKGYDVFKNRNVKIAILVNQGSASASEILAGALQYHGVGKLIGERTFGKGSVQQLIDLGEGATLKVTIARWLTPGSVSISEGGLTPDIEAKRTEKDLTEGKDPQVDAAVLYLLN